MQQNRQKDGSHNTENIDEKHHIETYNHKERKLFLCIIMTNDFIVYKI